MLPELGKIALKAAAAAAGAVIGQYITETGIRKLGSNEDDEEIED